MRDEELALRLLDFIRRHALIPPGKLVVAVSGGPDSACLLHILYQLRQELKIKLHVAHLNHQLRGADAEADAGYVSDLAGKLKLPFTVERRDVMAYKTAHRISLEEAAREVRYSFLAEVAAATGAERVAVGHTTDDHLETILLHLLRGAGTRGLRGLQPCVRRKLGENKLTIIRPLLPLSRKETVEYCERHQLNPRRDVSNLTLSPLRNRIRLRLLPLLKGYNPRIAAGLLRTARIAADDLAYIEAEVARVWDTIARQQDDAIILDKNRFLELSPALRRHILFTAIDKLRGNIRDIEMRHIEIIMDALTRPAGKKFILPGGLIFIIEYDRYVVSPNLAALVPFPVLKGEFDLNIPGETKFSGWRALAEIITPEQIKPVKNNYETYLDLDKATGKLSVRTRQAGDRFQPLGMAQPKKLGVFMIDARIPRTWRHRIPVVFSGDQIVWVVSYRVDERVKVTEQTKRVLFLHFERA